jgi:uncharacterized Tic20 family protein
VCGAPLGAAPLGAGPPGGGGLTDDDRNLGLLAHLSAFVTFVGVPSFVGPLVVWLWKREEQPYVGEHAREALNFNLSVLLYTVIGGLLAALLAVVTLGIGLLVIVPVAIALGIAWVVIVIIAGMAASRGEPYRYPVTIRFLR